MQHLDRAIKYWPVPYIANFRLTTVLGQFLLDSLICLGRCGAGCSDGMNLVEKRRYVTLGTNVVGCDGLAEMHGIIKHSTYSLEIPHHRYTAEFSDVIYQLETVATKITRTTYCLLNSH